MPQTENKLQSVTTRGRRGRWLAGEWYCPETDRDSHERLSIMTVCCTSGVVGTLCGGNLLTGMYLRAGADESFIGLLAIITQATSFLQVFMPIILERFQRRKTFLIWSRVFNLFLNVVLMGLIPMLPGETNFRLGLIAVNTALISALNGLWNVGANPWHMPFITEKTRSNFYAIYGVINVVLTTFLSIAASAVVDVFDAVGLEFEAMLGLRGVAVLICICETVVMLRIRELPYPKPEKAFNLLDILRVPIRNKAFMATVTMCILYSLNLNIRGSYYTVYMLEDLGASYSFVAWTNVGAMPVYILLTKPITRWIKNRNWTTFKTLAIGMVLCIPGWVADAFVTRSNMWVHAVSCVYASAAFIGVAMAFNCLMFENLPEEGRSIYIAFYSAVQALANMAAAAIGREIVVRLQDVTVNVLGTPMGNIQLMLLINCGVAVATGLIMYALDRKNEQMKAARMANR